MTIEVTDPGFALGAIVPQYKPYQIEMKRTKGKDKGKVFKVIEVSPRLYYYLAAPYALAQTALTGAMYSSGMLSQDALLSIASPGGSILALQLYTLYKSFKSVGTDQYGGITFAGKPLKQVSSGLVFLPWPLYELRYLSKTPMQVQFPGDPEKTFKGGDKAYFALSPELREKLALPIRALTAGPGADDKTSAANILDTQMTIEPTFTVRFVVDHFWVFLVNIGTYEEAIRQMRDAGEKAIIEEIAKLTPRQVAESIGKISEALRTAIEVATESWGISIVDVSMLSPDLSHDVNAALQSITTAKAAAQKLGIDTEAAAKATERLGAAEKVRLTLKGDGDAAAKLAELKAMAEGRTDLGVDGNAVIDLEKARAFASGNASIIVDGGGQSAGLVGFGTRLAAGAAVVNNQDKKGK